MATWNTVQAIRIAVVLDRRRQGSAEHRAARVTQVASKQTGAPASGSVWQALAQCESSGNAAAATGNGFYGLYQFTTSSWRAVGGSGLPSDATADEQTYRAQRLLDLQGPGAWPRCSYVAGLR